VCLVCVDVCMFVNGVCVACGGGVLLLWVLCHYFTGFARPI